MACAKDNNNMMHSSTTRSLSQHRPGSANTTASSRPAHNRVHSHSISSMGSLIPPPRVTRRKSVTSTANNVAAMVAAVTDSTTLPINMPLATRRALSKNRSAGLPSPPSSLSTTTALRENAFDSTDEVDDEGLDSSDPHKLQPTIETSNGGVKEKKGAAGDLKCDKCGKGYKHSSCLSKHLWEHTPEWSFTSKLLISKHQQVQLLEAASVLLTMNQGITPPESTKDFGSEQDGSISPTSSTGPQDLASSADTTPPPEAVGTFDEFRPNKRYSNGSGYSGYARSYQSSAFAPAYGSVPTRSLHSRQQSSERRPTSSGVSQNREDDGLAAAVELLSCSFGSVMPSSRALGGQLPLDAPPVPDIPAQYLEHSSYHSVLASSLQPRHAESYTRHTAHAELDVKMDDNNSADDEMSSQGRRDPSDEDDDGVFGRMEE